MRKNFNKEIRSVEVRALANTLPDDNSQIVEGYALVFEQPTVLWTDSDTGAEYKEVISRGALDGADMSDVPFKYNHMDNVMIMARTRNKTLQLVVDDKGLKIRADLAHTTAGEDLYKLIQRGDVDKMSFAFRVAEDDFDRQTLTRRINKFATIGDVAAVDTAAYDQTSIGVADEYNSAKAYFEQRKAETEKRAAIPFHKTGTIDDAWDGPAAKANLKTGPDVTADYYRQAFAWVDPDANADTKGAYKFIHHDVSANGDIGAANIQGCKTGIAVLNGSMGGSKIPDVDRQGVYDHLAAHIKDAKLQPENLKEAKAAQEDFEKRKKLLLRTYL